MKPDLLKQLRSALNHLYDLDYLRQCPLVMEFDLINRVDAAAALQRILLDAIEDFRPRIGEPLVSENQRVHQLLTYRYVQQFTQEEVAHQFGVSDRQFRRVQDNALNALAAVLWQKYSMKKPERPAQQASQPGAPHELDWLTDSKSQIVSNPNTFIESTLSLIQGVADKYGVRFELHADQALPDIAVNPVALRQVFLNLVRLAIHHAPGGEISIRSSAQPSFIQFLIEAHGGASQAAADEDPDQNLYHIAAQLVHLSGGSIEIVSGSAGYAVRMLLPKVESISVVAVDDNQDILDLLERYTAGTRYHIYVTSSPERVFELALTTGAQIIVLDVMIPQVDGWELLGRLKRDPQTAHIPVIIMTILPQSELAVSLGAASLVQKPVTQEQFLAALDAVFANQD